MNTSAPATDHPTDAIAELKNITFRVLAEYDKNYGYYVARCLETNSTATATTTEELVQIVRELLEEEISYAARTNTVDNLFARQAPPEVWQRWARAISKQEPEKITLHIKWPTTARCELDTCPTRMREVETEITVNRAA